nr:hypothetical protein [Pseudomonas japonica]
MRHIQPGRQRQADIQQVRVGALGHRIHQRRQHDEADIEQVRHADQQRGGADRPGRVLHRPLADKGIGDAVSPARTEQDAPEQGTQSDHGAGFAQGATEAFGEAFHSFVGAHARHHPQPQRRQREGQERVELELGNQQDQNHDGPGGHQQGKQFTGHNYYGTLRVEVGASTGARG